MNISNCNRVGCSNCNACLTTCPKKAISFFKNQKGFITPVIDEKKCNDCGLCTKVCPVLKNNYNSNSQQFYGAKLKNDRERAKSQSGGIFYIFAKYTIKSGGVVYGVVVDKENKVHYERACTYSKIKAFRGSKYVQPAVANIYEKVINDLTNGRKVLFSGTPCIVSGLLNVLKIKNICCDTLTTVDIVCHALSSVTLYHKYLSFFKKENNIKKACKINFRDKKYGWGSSVTTFKSGLKTFSSQDYFKIYYSLYGADDNCFNCKYANLNRCSDVTIGDFWGIEKVNCSFKDSKGVSLVIINSKKGLSLFSSIKTKIISFETNSEGVMQPSLIKPFVKPKDYNLFYNDYSTYGFEYVAFRYCKIRPYETVITHSDIFHVFIRIVKKHFIKAKRLLKRILGY